METRVRGWWTAVASGLLLGTAACGGSSPTPNPVASGPPIKLMLIGTIDVPPGGIPFPEVVDGAQSAARAINASGGVKGRPLQIEICDNKFDENVDAACGRKAVDNGVVALVGGYAYQGSHFAIVEKAGIPDLGNYPGIQAALTSPVSFPMIGGTLSGNAGPVAALVDVGKSQNIAAFLSKTNSLAGSTLIKKVLDARGLKLQTLIEVTPGSADVSSYVAQALRANPDGIISLVSAGDNDKITALVRQQKPKLAMARSATTLSNASLRSLGSLAEGILVPSQYLPPTATDNPGIKRFLKDINAYNKSAVLSDFALNSWAAVEVFAQVAGKLDSIDSASVLAALNKTTNADPLVGPQVNFTHPLPASAPALVGTNYTRAFNDKVTYNKVANGKIVNTINDKFFDPYTKP